MNGINCDGEGGWTRVGYLNMTQSGATCPTGLTQKNFTNIDHPVCGRESIGDISYCASTNFSTKELTYHKVCGQVRGYQFNHIDAFYSFSAHNNIDSPYIDGVSITHGTNPRNHIWTYIGGLYEDGASITACPCNTGYSGGVNVTATFIGSHYYCESGLNPGVPFSPVLYATDPLWDGQQCDGPESTCCPANSKMPWFYRSLDTQTTDNIELRICSNRGVTEEDVPIDIMELYIK